MILSDNLLHYLDSSSRILDCGIIITDLSNIIYANTSSLYSSFNFLEESNYISKPLSKNLTKTISKWSKLNNKYNLYEIYNYYYTKKNKPSIHKLTKDDKALYLSQFILPIFNNNKLEGLFICFSNHKHFISSSIKPLITTRNCIQGYLNNNHMLGVS